MTLKSRVLLFACVFLASGAEAKRVFIDFGEPGYESSGSNWFFDQTFDAALVGDLSSSAIAMGFSINIGGTTYDSIILNENGLVTFGSPLGTSGFLPTTDLSTLGVPIIAPYYADMVSTSNGDTDFEFGEIFYSHGEADPRPDASGNYSAGDGVPALHVTWNGPTVNGTPVITDLVIYSLGADGSFAIQFGHGSELEPNIPDLGGITGFALGDQVLNLTGARSGSEDLYFEFRATPPIPEPTAILSFSVGLGLLALAKRRFG